MTRRLPHIPLRRPIFVGCEGASEASYAALLQDLANEAALPVHLRIVDLGLGAGDPLARIEMAVRHINQQRQKRLAPVASFTFLDADQAEGDPLRAERARRLAVDNDIRIIWQQPCFEALLLRHLPGRAAHRPPDTAGALRALEREWADYRKPTSRVDLARRVNLDAVLRAAGVEPELAILLRALGLLT